MTLPRVLAAALSVVIAAPAQEHARKLRIPMRDGVRLAANLFAGVSAEPRPTILIRTPYGKGAQLLANYRTFVERGYNVVVQDVRGRYDSEGAFRPLEQEQNDGDDTLTWIAKQPWSDGGVAMAGGSYLGIAQWKAALTGNPHLRAIFPVVSGCDEFRDRFYSSGGAMKVGHRMQWIADNLRPPGTLAPHFPQFLFHLPLRTLDLVAAGQRIAFWQDALDHPAYDTFWRARSTCEQIDKVKVPVFSVAGWYDNFAPSDLDAFARLSRLSGAHRMIVGPWPHNMTAKFDGVDFGPNSGAPVRRYQLAWFDHWLRKPRPVADFPQPPLRIFIMGANRWRDEREWPLARTRLTRYYLSSRGSANTLFGDGMLAPELTRIDETDTFLYDPRRPVPTTGGPVCCNPKVFPWGPLDQRAVEARRDVLVYTSAPLRQDIEVTGTVRAVLQVSTSARDTDFTAKLVDVHPDGHARNLTDGIVRLRYRKSLETTELAVPGRVYEINVDCGVTSNVFKAGHRIRLEVSSSNFPRFDRNPNTGRPIATETQFETATQTVYHGPKLRSYLLLPVVP